MNLSRVKRAVLRSLFFTIRRVLVVVEVTSPRSFMQIYSWLLRTLGVNFNGVPRYISRRVRFDDFELITLGDRAVVSEGVVFLTHDYSLTTGLISLGATPDSDMAFVRGISVGNNVFIGLGSILLPGTVLGDNIVVGAGSVVRGVFESNCVIAGNPAVQFGPLADFAEKWKARSMESTLRVD